MERERRDERRSRLRLRRLSLLRLRRLSRLRDLWLEDFLRSRERDLRVGGGQACIMDSWCMAVLHAPQPCK